jgi:hypothetical protein
MNLPHSPALAAGDQLNALESALYRGRLGRRNFFKLAMAAVVPWLLAG